jgi:hypothetical protein
MDRREKIDCRANGEVIFRATRPLSLKVPKHIFTGSSAEPNGSHSPISTKIGIDPPGEIGEVIPRIGQTLFFKIGEDMFLFGKKDDDLWKVLYS